MNKTALAVAIPLAVVGLAVAGAWYTGTRVEQEVNRSLAEANTRMKELAPDAGISFSLLGIERGLFSSTARYQVNLADDKGGAPRTLVIADRLEHGPFPPARLARGELAPVMAQSHFSLEQTPLTQPWFAATAGQVPLSGELTIGYDRSQTGELNLAALNYSARNDVLRLSPARLAFALSPDSTDMKVAAQLDELDLTTLDPESAKPVRIELRGIALAVRKLEMATGFATGPGSIKARSFAVQTEGAPRVVLQDVEVEEALNKGAKGLDQTVSYRIGKLGVADHDIGSLTLALSARDLDEAALKQLSDTYNQVALANLNSADPLSAQLTPVQQTELQARAMRLLEGAPKLALDELSLRTAHGEARMNLALDLRKPQGAVADPTLLAAQMLAGLKAEVKVDKPLIGDLVALKASLDGGQLDAVALKQESDAASDLFSGMALNSKWARLEGNSLVSRLSYADAMVNFNGQAMSVQDFLAFALGSAQGLGLSQAAE
ncbi:YdgA family protein [Pseudomonas citronellolis]|uniref:YdgA family protein n=1 Tax=Pseudomonas citronellolis TaxID=53408 RepID=UPI0023E45119|nr:YdgA family protein [Pseudomonas citronellolis]MDF3931706.1 YdgA family protein [Pseudomonas citronellolis]